MSTFLEQEKARYTAAMETTHQQLFSPAARTPGLYGNHIYPFCLPPEYAAENLAPAIRSAAIAYFAAHGIQWHQACESGPSNYLCSSQVFCVNFLFPFRDRPEAFASLLRPIFPRLARMLPVEDDQYIAFEWIGQRNYLKERVARGTTRARGTKTTSADAIVLFERDDGLRQIVLIEWKYTERYTAGSIRYSRYGTDRLQIYAPFLDLVDCPIRLPPNVPRGALFVAPFDQLMRLQLLAREMERARELGADIASVLHISPASNHELRRVTSKPLLQVGSGVEDVWAALVHPSERFTSISIEEFWAIASAIPAMGEWQEYMRLRYPWMEG